MWGSKPLASISRWVAQNAVSGDAPAALFPMIGNHERCGAAVVRFRDAHDNGAGSCLEQCARQSQHVISVELIFPAVTGRQPVLQALNTTSS